MGVIALLCGMLLTAGPLFAGMDKESLAKGANSAAEAFARYGAKRIGILLVGADQDPAPGFRYAGRALLTYHRELEGDPMRMPQHYELRLYEAIRGAFQARGFAVKNLNRGAWQGLRLEDVMAQAKGLDAVCAAHYSIRRKHTIFDRDGYTWSSPFEGMHLKIRLGVFDIASKDRIYELEGTLLGTEALYLELGEMVVEEPLYPSGYDEHGSPNSYKIAIYNTSVKDLRGAERQIPVIRTAQGSLEIDFVGGWTTSGKVRLDHEMRKLNIPIPEDVAEKNSILARLLEYVSYRPSPDDIEYFDLKGIERCGQMVQERLPERP